MSRTAPLALVAAVAAGAAFFALGESEPPAPGPSSPAGGSRYAGRIIDTHVHVHPASLDRALALFEERGIARAINLLPIPYTPRNWAVVDQMTRRSEGRLLPFVGVDWRQLSEGPGFGERMAENLEAAVEAGALGLKIPKGLGLGAPAPEGGLLAVDDPRLDPLFEKAGELGVPVAIHVGDPVAFWEPVTPDNERYEELSLNPGWSNYGKPVPSHQELMAQQRRRFARHPETTFIAVHVAGYPEDLAWVDALLDELDNVVIDLAARIPALGHHPTEQVRPFFLKHQDRILFGTDLGVDPGGLMLGAPLAWEEGPADVERFFASTWRYLETEDEGFAHPTPIQGDWTIDGLGLPDEVLRKVYFENAERVLSLAPDSER